MTQETIAESSPAPSTAYGRFIRERGTRRILLGAILLAIAYYIYSAVHTSLMLQRTWPALKPDAAGLTVLGIGDPKNKNVPHKYEARESSHAWQVRYRDDSAGESGDDESTPESKDIGGNRPAASHDTNQGAVVPMEELLATCPIVMTGRHFTGADIEQKQDPFFMRSYWVVHLSLSDEGRSRYWHFSRDHDEERLAFILRGEVIACPRIATMDTSTLDIDPIWIKADADRVAAFINTGR